MKQYSIKKAFFRSIAVHLWLCKNSFPEQYRSISSDGFTEDTFPGHCRSILKIIFLIFNVFRSISVHSDCLSFYLCVQNYKTQRKIMAGTIVDMSKIKQVLMLKLTGVSNRKISQSLGINKETVNKYVAFVETNGLDVSKLLKMDDPELERVFHPGNPAYSDERLKIFMDELPYYRSELTDRHVTKSLLYEEYKAKHPNGYGKSQFFFHLKQNLVASKGPTAVLTDTYVPGQYLFVDYAGDKLSYVDLDTGEIIKVETFVATLPFTDYAYAICVPSQRLDDFIFAIRMTLEYIGGVPTTVVPDNLKAAVVKADKYEPTINKAFEDMGNHYGFVVVPCQPHSPTQKSLVENHVKLVYHHIYAKLRKRTFFSLQSLNEAVWQLLHEHNQTRMKERPYSREERFHAIEKDALKPLPTEEYEIKYTSDVHVQQNGFVKISKDNHYYSVPYTLIGKKARIIFTRTTVKIYVDNNCVATHMRTYGFGYTKIDEHLASNNKAITDRSPKYFMDKGYRYSVFLGQYIEQIFNPGRTANPPELYYKSCSLLIGLTRKYDHSLIDEACKLCMANGVYSCREFERVLKRLKAELAGPSDIDAPTPSNHENMRGCNSYI